MNNAVMTANLKAKQDLNALYLNQTGSKVQKSVIEWFIGGTIFFQISSALFSAFGFYFDFRDSLGLPVAVALGLGLGIFIEISKHKSVDGAFATFEPVTKVIYGGVAFVLMVIALSYHYKSMNTFENLSVKDDLQKQVDFEKNQLITTNNNISELIANNKELSKVLNNNNNGDDILATKSIISTNELMGALVTLNGSSTATNALLKQSEKSAKQNSNTLLLLFVTMEFFALFGIIGKFTLNRNTDKNVKEIVTTMNRLDSVESNVIMATQTALINNTIKRVNNHLHNSPTPTPVAPTNEEIALKANMPTNAYFMDFLPKNGQNSNDAYKSPLLNATNAYNSECYTQNKEDIKDDITKNNIDKKESLNLLNFGHKENEIIKIMYENGAVKKGDRLLQKRIVKKHFSEDRLIKSKDVDDLYELLEELDLIEFRGGYRAKSDMESIVKNS